MKTAVFVVFTCCVSIFFYFFGYDEPRGFSQEEMEEVSVNSKIKFESEKPVRDDRLKRRQYDLAIGDFIKKQESGSYPINIIQTEIDRVVFEVNSIVYTYRFSNGKISDVKSTQGR